MGYSKLCSALTLSSRRQWDVPSNPSQALTLTATPAPAWAHGMHLVRWDALTAMGCTYGAHCSPRPLKVPPLQVHSRSTGLLAALFLALCPGHVAASSIGSASLPPTSLCTCPPACLPMPPAHAPHTHPPLPSCPVYDHRSSTVLWLLLGLCTWARALHQGSTLVCAAAPSPHMLVWCAAIPAHAYICPPLHATAALAGMP